MSPSKKQLYLVIHGRQPGIYTQWFGPGQAAEQVADFSEAIYKGFYTREEALNWLREFPLETLLKLAPRLVEYLEEESDALPTLAQTIAAYLKAGKVVIFTDGSAHSKTGAGGYGVILKYKDSVKELSGGFRKTTNNRMEILACIVGLQALKVKSHVIIFSDSQYVVNSLAKGWAEKWRSQGWMRNKKEPAENADLWAQLLELCDQHTVEFEWVKAHNSTRENERCDQLAYAASQKRNLPPDPGYEKQT
jgi:ribonuclease HI